MRKIFLALTVLLTSVATISCSDDKDDDRKIDFAEVPVVVKTFLKNHFSADDVFDESQVKYVELDQDGSYDIKLLNGIEFDFSANGDWQKIDMNGNPLPVSVAALVPIHAIDYITSRYPNQAIEEIERKANNNIELELRPIDIEILFDANGVVLKDPGTGGTHRPETGIDPSLLPQSIQDFLEKHFSNVKVVEIKKDYKEYEIELFGYEVEFDLDGNFKNIEAEKPNSVPESIFADSQVSPNGKTMSEYVKTNHDGMRIEEFSKLSSYFTGAYKDGYKIELDGTPDFEIFFTKDGKHIVTNID